METDYLVVGGGGTAMAFVDSLLDAGDATVTIVDRRERPGGHWNDAYPFVRLHQPNAWYGVASTPIPDSPDDADDPYGRGAAGETVLAYFERLMHDRFLPSGRVRWLPRTEYLGRGEGTHRVRSLGDGATHDVVVRRKLVDATLTATEIPATRPPPYPVAPGVRCIAPNDLPSAPRDAARYTVVGAGKTGMDAALWLLDAGVAPARIRWIVPRDPWLLDRDNLRGGAAHVLRSLHTLTAQYRALATARDVGELFAMLEACGAVLRLDPAVAPTKIRGAIISRPEIERLRAIPDVVRLGRVVAIESGRIVLERGARDVARGEIFVDCSASAVRTPASLPVFDGDAIRLLMVSWGQPLFSAALIAHVEATIADPVEQRRLCSPVLFPERLEDWATMWSDNLHNAGHWREHPSLHAWLRGCRLHPPTLLMRGVPRDDPALQAAVREMSAAVAAAARRLAHDAFGHRRDAGATTAR